MSDLTVLGVTKPLAVWAEGAGLSTMCLHMRIRNGWPPEIAVARPKRSAEIGNLRARGTAPTYVPRPKPPRKVRPAPKFKQHGYSKHPLYKTWRGMLQRCYDTKFKFYRHYGGRGITVTEAWRTSFLQFAADMGPKPHPDLSIDRINNDGNYESSNCRWADQRTQVRNSRRFLNK